MSPVFYGMWFSVDQSGHFLSCLCCHFKILCFILFWCIIPKVLFHSRVILAPFHFLMYHLWVAFPPNSSPWKAVSFTKSNVLRHTEYEQRVQTRFKCSGSEVWLCGGDVPLFLSKMQLEICCPENFWGWQTFLRGLVILLLSLITIWMMKKTPPSRNMTENCLLPPPSPSAPGVIALKALQKPEG